MQFTECQDFCSYTGRNTVFIDGLVLLPLKVVKVIPLATWDGKRNFENQQASSCITGSNYFSSKFTFNLKILLPRHPETDSQKISLVYIILIS